jgi:hypothetical protein
MEGSSCFEPRTDCSMEGLTLPILEYTHDEGCSVTGGIVYRGCSMPDLHGAYFYGDFCGGFVRSFVIDAGEVTEQRDHTTDLFGEGGRIAGLSSFGEDARGELYMTSLSGLVYKIVSAE